MGETPNETITITTTEEAAALVEKLSRIVQTFESQIGEINAKLLVAHENDVFHVIAYRVALRGVCEALAVFTDPDHGPITKRDWEFIQRNEKHAWEMLEND